MQNYTGHGWEGSNYPAVKNLSVVEIAKLIRAELKYKFPQYKFSVSSELFAGGCAINAYIKGGLDSSIFTPEFKDWLKNDGHNPLPRGHHEYNEKTLALIKTIEAIVNKYNYDDSDSQIDYFSTNFYSHVGIHWEYNSELREELK